MDTHSINNIPKKILITGGAGFIGSSLIRYLIAKTDTIVLNIDKLTYAGNLDSLRSVLEHPRYSMQQIDICDRQALRRILSLFQPDAVMHLAAESHVDRSINSADAFVQTNLIGTFSLLEETKHYWLNLSTSKREAFRFHHISTDEVFGSLASTGKFTEKSRYQPNSPYSATKAGSDHLVRAWHSTYGLPIIITNCSNNYGPYQFPEKLIPHVILNALQGNPLTVYGDGEQIRDWLYVEDHVKALCLILREGQVGETYNIGGNSEQKNIDVVMSICNILENCRTITTLITHNIPFRELIVFVKDRPGHDKRYAIDANKLQQTLNWAPQETFETGLRRTVLWYLQNESWWQNILQGTYQLDRLGIIT